MVISSALSMAPKRRLILCLILIISFFLLRARLASIANLAFIASYLLVIAIFIHSLRDVVLIFRDSVVFHPESPPHSRACVASPDVFGLRYEEHYVSAKDGVKLHFYFVKGTKRYEEEKSPSPPPPPTILFFHGNSGNIGHRLPNVNLIVRALKWNALLPEYRGFGKSEGHPSEATFYSDAEVAMEFLRQRNDVGKIVIFGRSLGGAIALHLLSNTANNYTDSIHFGVIENSFTSLVDLARLMTGAPSWIPDRLFCGVGTSFPNAARVRHVRTPMLFLSSAQDDVIPATMMRRLYDLCLTRAKRLVTFASSGHVDAWMARGYVEEWMAFAQHVADGKEGNDLIQIGDICNNNNNNNDADDLDDKHMECATTLVETV